MPERIHSMSSTMSIVGCCPKFSIEHLPRTNAARSVHLTNERCFQVCPLPYFVGNLHIRGLSAVEGERPVAFTGDGLEHLPVSYAQIAAPVTDGSRGLDGPCYDGNARAAHAEVLGDSLLSNLNHVLFYAIGNQQQPDRKSLLHGMKNGASGAMRNL